MLKQFVDVVSSLLLVGLTLGALFPAVRLATGRDPARPGPRPVLWGTLTGALLGLAMIIVHHNSIVRFNRQRLTLTTLEPTVILGVALLVMMWVFGRRTVKALRAFTPGAARILEPNPVPPLWRTIVTVVAFAWAALIVFRDIQLVYMQTLTFVPIGATVFSTATFLNVVGYLAGVMLVILAAIAVARMCQARPSWSLPMLTLFSVLITFTHVFLIVRLLHAIRVIYLSPAAANSMSWLINHEVWLVLIGLAIGAGAAILLWDTGRRIHPAGPNPAVERTQRATARSMTRRSALGIATYTAAFLALTVGERFSDQEVELSDPEDFELSDTHALIPLSKISDGHLHRYVYDTSSGVTVRWIVIQKAGSSYGVGLDACEICGPSGYYEQDGQVICKLCSVAMNIATIGFPGGCNPIPIDYEVANNQLAIPLSVLEDSADVFA
ncbi:MAG: Fe-S-containing protein [Bowdeniella nasicola]|nr:Fe-S-containing protein [Bowdeniella nasicola]